MRLQDLEVVLYFYLELCLGFSEFINDSVPHRPKFFFTQTHTFLPFFYSPPTALPPSFHLSPSVASASSTLTVSYICVVMSSELHKMVATRRLFFLVEFSCFNQFPFYHPIVAHDIKFTAFANLPCTLSLEIYLLLCLKNCLGREHFLMHV